MPKYVSSLELPLDDRPPGITLGRWLHEQLRSAIVEERLRPGTRLPATRDFARQYGIARGTVVEVFEQLVSAGYLRSKVGSGTWVSQRPRARSAVRTRPSAAARPGPLRGLSFERTARPFRLHEPAIAEFPVRVWSRVASRRMRGLSAQLLSGNYAGSYPPLQAALADYLASARGVKCGPEQIVITSGVQQGLDLLARVLIKPGDPAWLEEPGYFGAALAFSNANARLIPVPVEAGMRLCAEATCAYVTPGHQFPLGATLTGARRLDLLQWARRSAALVIEDDYDSEYRFDGKPVPALQGQDRDGNVVLVGTFNKLLFPSVRMGYVVLPPRLMDRFHAFRYGTDLGGTSLMQAIVCDFITEGHLGRHIRRTRELYGARLEALLESARRHLRDLLDMSPVRAGLYTVGRLRNGMTSRTAEAVAIAASIETMGLHRFAVTSPTTHGLLLGFAAFDERQISRAVMRLAEALQSAREGRSQSTTRR